MLKKFSLFCLLFTLVGCGLVRIPEGVDPVENFDKQQYLGKWYEIARLDHSFERGLSKVTAEYSLRADGGIKVVNRGYSEQEKTWDEAIGKAYFVGEETIGHLKVSFFGPFYASYVVFALDTDNYQWALVSGPNREYLWILSRSPTISEDVKRELLRRIESLDFPSSELIFVNH